MAEPLDRLSLDVDAPEKVIKVLRRAADTFYESAAELSAAWQDENAGKSWEIIAKILERAAQQIDSKI